MKKTHYTPVFFMGSIFVFTSCNTSSKQSVNSEDSLLVDNQVITSGDSEDAQETFTPAQKGRSDDARRKAERSVSLANIEIEKEHNKIDKLFDNLFEANSKLTEAKRQSEKYDVGTSDYTSAQLKVNTSEEDLQIVLDNVNRQYAKINGFMLTASNCEDLAEVVKDKIKSHVAVEILEKHKRITLEEVENKY